VARPEVMAKAADIFKAKEGGASTTRAAHQRQKQA